MSDPVKMGMSVLGITLGVYIFTYVKKNLVKKCPTVTPLEIKNGALLSCRGGTEVLNLNLGDDDPCKSVCVDYPELQREIAEVSKKVIDTLALTSNSIIEAFKEMEKIPMTVNYHLTLPRIKGLGDVVKPVEAIKLYEWLYQILPSPIRVQNSLQTYCL
jgi:hypothetical protein